MNIRYRVELKDEERAELQALVAGGPSLPTIVRQRSPGGSM
jgi:hypothetical protein